MTLTYRDQCLNLTSSLAFTDYAHSHGTKYDYNGTEITIDKHQTLTLTDTAIALINRVDAPLFLYLSYVDPHLPPNPLPTFSGRFDGDEIPWKPDTAKYQENYPSFLYNNNIEQQDNIVHGEELDTTYRNALEVIAGVDSCMGEIFEALENTGKLDNTLIIFIADNGQTLGSHWLSGKTLAYEPSMRLPLFLRYPRWFAPASNVYDQFALNLDLAPTIYQAAGLQYPDQLHGLSLEQLYDGKVIRDEIFYVMLRTDASDPSIRAIRDHQFKYISYSCNSGAVEELFDMVNDSLELTNLVNNHNYASILEYYRSKTDSMKIAWNDTAASPLRNCYIANPITERNASELDEEMPQEPIAYPSITSGELEIYNPWPHELVEVFNDQGNRLSNFRITDRVSHFDLSGV